MYYSITTGPKRPKAGSRVKSVLTVMAAALTLAASPAPLALVSAGRTTARTNDNKEIVTGLTPPCVTTTVDPIGDVQLSTSTVDGVTVYNASPLIIRGSFTNCSASLQAYYVVFDEPSVGVSDILGQDACRLGFGTAAGDFIMKSGSSRGWSIDMMNQNIALAGMQDITACLGTHSYTGQVYDRTSGALMQTLSGKYSVVLK
jgi:hypothetical protein